MGEFSWICKECGENVRDGDHVIFMSMLDGQIIEWMQGYNTNYGNVEDKDKNIIDWKVMSWNNMVDLDCMDCFGTEEELEEMKEEISKNGMVAIHSKCWTGKVPTTKSERDPNQGWTPECTVHKDDYDIECECMHRDPYEQPEGQVVEIEVVPLMEYISVDRVVLQAITEYPTLFQSRTSVLEHYLLSYGTGCQWKNGSVVTGKDYLQKEPSADALKLYQVKKDKIKLHTTICEYSPISNIPDDVRPDWKEACDEMMALYEPALKRYQTQSFIDNHRSKPMRFQCKECGWTGEANEIGMDILENGNAIGYCPDCVDSDKEESGLFVYWGDVV